MTAKHNLEMKNFCKDFDQVREVLTELGARKEIIKEQVDYFFHLPQDKIEKTARLKLRIEDGRHTELIYYERPDFRDKCETDSHIQIYKVTDEHLLPFLIESLGTLGIVKKKREVWRKDHTVFHLDTVDGVGNIFEIELQKQDEVTDEDRNLFLTYRQKIEHVMGESIAGSNIDLVLKNTSE